jgi:hypothetical protein
MCNQETSIEARYELEKIKHLIQRLHNKTDLLP